MIPCGNNVRFSGIFLLYIHYIGRYDSQINSRKTRSAINFLVGFVVLILVLKERAIIAPWLISATQVPLVSPE